MPNRNRIHLKLSKITWVFDFIKKNNGGQIYNRNLYV